jgi:alpha-glucosidase
VHFRRPGGWHSVTNFGTRPVELPPGQAILASVPVDDGVLPADATAWPLEHGE